MGSDPLALVRATAAQHDGLHLPGHDNPSPHRTVQQAIQRLENGADGPIHVARVGDGSVLRFYEPDEWSIAATQHENTVGVEMEHEDSGELVSLSVHIPTAEIEKVSASHAKQKAASWSYKGP